MTIAELISPMSTGGVTRYSASYNGLTAAMFPLYFPPNASRWKYPGFIIQNSKAIYGYLTLSGEFFVDESVLALYVDVNRPKLKIGEI